MLCSPKRSGCFRTGFYKGTTAAAGSRVCFYNRHKFCSERGWLDLWDVICDLFEESAKVLGAESRGYRVTHPHGYGTVHSKLDRLSEAFHGTGSNHPLHARPPLCPLYGP